MNDLLDFAQIENNCFKLNKDYYNLLDLVQQAFKQLNHNAKRKNITFVEPSLTRD